jgi:hypothetical protein
MNAFTEDLVDLSAKCARAIIDLVEENKAVAQLHAPRGRKTEREMILVDHNEVPTTVGTIIDEIGENSENLLCLLENLGENPIIRSDMKDVFQIDDHSILDRKGAGGGKCDCCGKKRAGSELRQCS